VVNVVHARNVLRPLKRPGPKTHSNTKLGRKSHSMKPLPPNIKGPIPISIIKEEYTSMSEVSEKKEKKSALMATCSKCKGETYVNKGALESRVKKFGSVEAMNAKWECRKCVPPNPKKSKKEPKAPKGVTSTATENLNSVDKTVDSL
jgi:hypothetical protein